MDEDAGCLKVRIRRGHITVRVTTAFNMLLGLPGVNVTGIEFTAERVVVDVALRRRRLVCPPCDYSTAGRHNLQWTPLSVRCRGPRSASSDATPRD
jgi:hypothetical protein